MLNRVPFQYRITFLYILFGALWILFSDRFVLYFTNDPHRIQELSTIKGWFFVLITGILLYFLIRKEIRRRNKIILELRTAKEKADEADRLKTTFLANLSHYVRTPMNSILGFIELIEDKDTDPENHDVYLSYIQQSSENLLQTLTSIIELSKIQEGQLSVASKPCKLNDIVERVTGLAQVGISEKKKEITVIQRKGMPDGQDVIISDPDKVFLICSNLTTNAVRFTTRGEIEIGYFIAGNEIRFWVRDTGRGISAEKQAYLFSNYLHNAEYQRESAEGSGLGLALSARLATLLGGNLWLDSTGQEGSTFCLKLPVLYKA
jgi:signal transduction histidine kinase